MKYQIYKDGFTSNCTNCNYYFHYEMYEFDALNDTDAYKKAENYQHECEQHLIDDGIDPDDWDPCFVENISRYDPKKDAWIDVEY